jgi:tRNA threonylcarbamoyl adenosine modification protein YjeE
MAPGDLILLQGRLGAGKTRLAKGLVAGAAGAATDDVVSPSFTLINSYDGDFPVHHADLYRIDQDQIDGIGLFDTIQEGGALVVEWAEKLGGLFEGALSIVISPGAEDNFREIVFDWDEAGPWHERMEDLSARVDP